MNGKVVYSMTGNKPVFVLKCDSSKLLLCYYYKCKMHVVYVYCDSASMVMEDITPEVADKFIEELTARINRPNWFVRLLKRLFN